MDKLEALLTESGRTLSCSDYCLKVAVRTKNFGALIINRSSQVAKKYCRRQGFYFCEKSLIGGNEGSVEEMGKSNERRIVKGDIMFPGRPEGFFRKKKIKGVYLEGKGKGLPYDSHYIFGCEAFLESEDVAQFVEKQVRHMDLKITMEMSFEN